MGGTTDENNADANTLAADQNAVVGACVPSNELCDGKDNDCDGLIDEVCLGYVPLCENGKQDAGEQGIDCGTSCHTICAPVKPEKAPTPYSSPLGERIPLDPVFLLIGIGVVVIAFLMAFEHFSSRKEEQF